MRRAAGFGIVIALLSLAGVDAQRPAPTVPPTATIAGQVIVPGSAPLPVRDALVMVAGIDVGLLRAVATDASGRFLISGLPPGRFLVSAGKPRYVAAMYGASRPGRPGSVITLRPGDSIKDMRLSLAPGGVIGGRVTDDAGQPIAGARVRVLGRRAVGTEVALTGDAGEPTTALTDDDGVYRVFALPPGDYVVGVQPRGIVATGNGSAIGYGPVYFPNTPQAASATPIRIVPGDERNVNIELSLAHLVRIDGTIGGLGGVPPQNQISLRPRGLDVSGTLIYAQNTRAGVDGRFSFTNVPPGEYTAFARTLPPPAGAAQEMSSGAPPAPVWAATDVIVRDTDITDLTLTWQRALSVSGRVEVQGLAQLPSDVRVRVGLRATPGSNVLNPAEQAAVDATGHFTLEGVLPGKYWLTATIPANPATQVPDWFAKSAMSGGIDAFDLPLEVKADAHPDVLVTLTDDAQQIDGVVHSAHGQPIKDCPIVAFPVDARFWFPQSRRIVVRPTNERGELLFGLASALPVGEYFVAAAPDLVNGEQFDSHLLAELAKTAVRVSLGANESKTVTIVSGG